MKLSRKLVYALALVTAPPTIVGLGAAVAVIRTIPDADPRPDAALLVPDDPATVRRFEGEGYELGRRVGRAFALEIRALERSWLDPLYGRGLLRRMALARARAMEPHIPAELRAEMHGLAAGAGIPDAYDSVLLANLTPDLMQLVATPFACSSLAVTPLRAASGHMLVGRNLDYPMSDALRGRWRPVIYAQPGKRQVLAITVPGLVGVVTGVNDQGVYAAMHVVLQTDQTSNAIPSIMHLRLALAESDDALAAAKRLTDRPRPAGTNVMLADGKAVFSLERRAHEHGMRLANSAGVLYTANHYESHIRRIIDMPADWRRSRLARWDEATSPLSLGDVRATIAATGQLGLNVLATFLDYGTGTFYYGSESDPAALGRLSGIDLGRAFKPDATSGAKVAEAPSP